MYQRKFRVIALTTILAVYCVPGMANMQTWTFDKSTQSFEKDKNKNKKTKAFNAIAGGNSTGKIKADKRLHLTAADGVNLTVRGYSDTRDVARGEDMIKSAKMAWASDTALGIRNKDETTKGNNRAADSVVTGTKDPDGDFDMMLLEFDTAVSLTGMQLEWAQGGNAANTADISIMAYTGEGSDKLVGNTWAQVLGSGTGDAFDTVGNYSNVDLSYYAVNPTTVTSTKWLIGVYNPVFGPGGDGGNDGFRLASIHTSITNEFDAVDGPVPDVNDVPVPGSLTLMVAGLLALRARRNR